MNSSHPEKQCLVDYSSGILNDQQAQEVARHLDECTACEATIRSLEAKSDTFVAGLRKPPKEQPLLKERPYLKSVDAAIKLAGAPEGKTLPSAVENKSAPAAEKKLGPYVILAKLGEGGMGAVFKAKHEHLGKVVAIKVLPKKAMQDPAAVARFRREMLAVGQLHHPNIVIAFDAGEAQGIHYLTMEYVEGSDLSTIIKKNGPVTIEQAISYTAQAAKGLAFAHSKNIVHRDIKPANLLVDAEGTVKILDMGLARLDDGGAANAEANQGLTQTGQVMGTVDYMAPEQAFDTHRADAKADVYSLGCTLFRILTGQNSYGGETVVQKILAHREQPIPSLAKLCPQTPAALDALYQRMMAKRPEDRPTMAEVVKELEAITNPQAAAASAPAIVIDVQKSPIVKKPEPAKKPVRREAQPSGSNRRAKPPVKLIAGGIGGFALILSGVLWFIIRDKDGNELARFKAPDGATVTMSSEPGASATGGTKTMTPPPIARASGSLPRAVTAQNNLADPAFQAWLKATQALPAEQQLEAVRKKLMELNPGFDGKLTASAYGATNSPKIENGVVVDLGLVSDHVENLAPLRALSGLRRLNCSGSIPRKGRLVDLSPLAGLPLTNLSCAETQVVDLTPLSGMPLKALVCNNTQVADLTPLVGMPLTDVRIFHTAVSDLTPLKGMKVAILYCFNTSVSDLTPLAGMPLTSLNCSDSQVADLTPLKGMPLPNLWFHDTLVSDVTPLAGMPLTSVRFTPANITRGIDVLREMTTLTDLGLKHQTTGSGVYKPAEFWKKYDAGEFAKSNTPMKLAYLDPAFQQWVEATQKLSAEQQLEAVSKKLMELNPGFDGKLTGADGKEMPKIENGVVTEVRFSTDAVADISPVRILAGLTTLNCSASGEPNFTNGLLTDLAPLTGLALTSLDVNDTNVADLTPLAGLPLERLSCFHTRIGDLTPLRGMPLKYLSLHGSRGVVDLSPLRGLPLTFFSANHTHLTDVTPLSDCPTLTSVNLGSTKVTAENVDALQQALPKCKIYWKSQSPTTTADSPEFQQWVEATQKLSADRQLEAVSKKLMELNPGFDGKLTGFRGPKGVLGGGVPKVDQGIITEAGLITENVTDLSPLRGFNGLRALRCAGGPTIQGKLTDLSPLAGLPLTKLEIDGNPELSGLSPLREMKLTIFSASYTAVTELTLQELKGMPLEYLHIGSAELTDLSFLEGMPLDTLYANGSFSDLSPLRGMPLRGLLCNGRSQVSDLSPLKGMPLLAVSMNNSPLSDLSPLAECKGLQSLEVRRTKVTAAQVAALQKALPECKIVWDDPAKTPAKP